MSTVEAQIREARERADMFASSLNKAKEQEGYFEEERQKWVLSFEEKSSMIEQLERELTSTVDALNHEKQEKSMALKDLMQSTPDGSILSHSKESVNMRRHSTSGYVDKASVRHEYPERSNHRHDHTSEADASSRRVLELLQQSQEETTQVRRDLSIMRVERDRLSDQVTVMKRQMERIIDEKEQLAKSLKNSENRMLLRDKQVTDHELERERNSHREIELTEIITTLEKQLSSQRNDLQTVGDHRTALEKTVMDLNRKIHDPSSSIQDRFDKMDRMAQELTRRAESAEDTLRTLMDVGADFDIPRRRSIDFQTENVNPIGIAAVRPIDSIDDVAPRTKVDFSKFPSEYGTLMPSELSLLELRKSNDTAQKYFEEFSRNQNPILEFGPNDNFVHYDYNVRPDGLKQLQNPPVPKKSIKSKGKSKSGTTRSVGTKEGAAPSLSSGKRKISSTPKGSSESIDSKSAGTSRRTSRNHNLSLGSEYGYNPEPKAHTRKSPPTRCVSLTPSEKPRPVRSSSQPVLPSRSSQYGKNSVYTPPVTGPRSISSSSSRVLTQTKKSTIERNSTFNSENNGMKCRTPGKTGHHTPSQPSSATRLGTKKNSTPVHRPGRGLGSSAVISDISGRYKLQVTIPSGQAENSFETEN